MKKPLIGMCVLGRPQATEKCIKALLLHTDRSKFQWAVLDQNATPEVKEVIHKYRKEFDYIGQNSFNTGIVFGHNFLMSLRQPSQIYIKWDDDSVIESDNWLNLILKALSYPDIGSALAIRPTFFVDSPGRKEFFYKEIKIEERAPHFWIYISPDRAGVVGCVWAFKGEMLDQLQFFNEDLQCDDLDMPLRISMLALKNIYLPDCVIKQNEYQLEENIHPRKWIAKALYNKNVIKSPAYYSYYTQDNNIMLESRFGGWNTASKSYINGSNENWNFCEQGKLVNITGTFED
jgi:GT2 family glycosyltransferase